MRASIWQESFWFGLNTMDEIFGSSNTIELLKAGAGYLESHGVADSRAEADILLAAVLKVSRAKLYSEPDWNISMEEKNSYQELLKRRGNREPLAYLLKTREFMGLEFYVDENVLIPRPETELLVEKTLEIGKNKAGEKRVKVLDLCTGSGAIAVSLAFFWPLAAVTAVDISSEALKVAQKNAAQFQVEVDFRQGDLFQPAQGEQYDIIVSNPPYVSVEEYEQCSPEVRREPVSAFIGGQDGLDFYRRIALEGERYLTPGGTVLVEIGCNQGPAVAGLFEERGYKAAIYPDYSGLDRIVLAEKE